MEGTLPPKGKPEIQACVQYQRRVGGRLLEVLVVLVGGGSEKVGESGGSQGNEKGQCGECVKGQLSAGAQSLTFVLIRPVKYLTQGK